MQYTDYALLDQKVCQLAASIETNILAFTNPQNLEAEKQKFLAALEKKEEYNPVFVYVPRNPIYSYFTISPAFNTYKNELKELLDGLEHGSTLSMIYERKILDLFERMELIRSVGTENFAGNSESYYGSVNAKTLRYAKEILEKKTDEEDKTIGFEDAKKTIQGFLSKKKISYKIAQKEEGGSRFSVNLRTKEILISKNTLFSNNSIKRLIAHEIEGHIYRYENGLRQPYLIFSRGLSKETLETEEGLAVYVERQEKINIDSQLREYAGRVVAISTAARKSFFETYQEMRRHFTEESAFNLTLRAKRGTYKQDREALLQKDALYLTGFLTVEEYLKEHKLEKLYCGRYSIGDMPLVMDVDGIQKPKYMPNFVGK